MAVDELGHQGTHPFDNNLVNDLKQILPFFLFPLSAMLTLKMLIKLALGFPRKEKTADDPRVNRIKRQ